MKSVTCHSPAGSDKHQSESCKKRPSTPHPVGKKSSSSAAFKFEDLDDSLRDATSSDPVGGCIGVSFTDIIKAFQSPTSSSRPTTPRNNNGNGTPRAFIKDNFLQIRSILSQTMPRQLKPLHCHSGGRNSAQLDQSDVMSWLSEDTTFDEDKSLLHRASSWNTLETEPNLSQDGAASEGLEISTQTHGKYTVTATATTMPSSSSKHVQFQYPPITSVRLRPRTQSCEIQKLFFAEEELDQIEDDRLDTAAADDVETLMVGEEWNVLPTCTSSTTAASVDENVVAATPNLIGGNIMFDGMKSSRSFNGTKRPGTRFVKGVQIMLREKSTK